MIYLISSAFAGQILALLGLSVVGVVWKRKWLYLVYGLLGGFFGLLHAFLVVRFASNMIDFVSRRVFVNAPCACGH